MKIRYRSTGDTRLNMAGTSGTIRGLQSKLLRWACMEMTAGITSQGKNLWFQTAIPSSKNPREPWSDFCMFFLTAYLGLRKSTEDCPNKMIIFSAKSNSGGLDLCRFPVFALRVSRLVPDYSLTRVYALLVWSFKAVQQFKVSTYGVFTKDGVTTVCN